MPRFAPEEPLPTLVSGDIALTATVARDGAGARAQVAAGSATAAGCACSTSRSSPLLTDRRCGVLRQDEREVSGGLLEGRLPGGGLRRAGSARARRGRYRAGPGSTPRARGQRGGKADRVDDRGRR